MSNIGFIGASGLMGHGSTVRNVDLVLAALQAVLA
jgi:hypothetical protein